MQAIYKKIQETRVYIYCPHSSLVCLTAVTTSTYVQIRRQHNKYCAHQVHSIERWNNKEQHTKPQRCGIETILCMLASSDQAVLFLFFRTTSF